MKIGRRAILGVLWTTGGKFAGFAVHFTCQLVLVRFLLPEEFGTFALALSIFQVITIIIEGNFSTALIQMQDEPGLRDTAFVLCASQGGIILALSLAVSLLLRWHGISDPKLPFLCMILGVSHAVNPVVELYRAELEMRFRYPTLTRISIVSALAATGVAVILAIGGFGIWSLAARELSAVVALLAGHRLTSRTPFRFAFSKEAAQKLLDFAKRMIAASGLAAVFDQADIFLLGTFFGLGVLGYYSQARYLVALVHSGIWAVNAVSFPLYANLKQDRRRLGESYRILNFFLIRAMFPFSIVFFLFPSEIVSLLFGATWRPAGDALRWLGFSCVVIPVLTNLESLLYGLGEVGVISRIRGLMIIAAVGFIGWGAGMYGLGGAALGFMFSMITGLVALDVRIRRHHRLEGISESLWGPSLAAGISMLCVILLERSGFQNQRPGKFLGLAVFGAAVYVIFLFAVERRRLKENVSAVIASFKAK